MFCSIKQACIYAWMLALIPFAAQAAPLSITEAVNLATRNNLALLQQRVQADAASRRIEAASIFFQENPEIEGEVGRRTGETRSNDWGVRVSHPLPLNFARSKRIEAAEHAANAQNLQLAAFTNQLVAEVRGLYHRVFALQEELAIAEQEFTAAQRLRMAASERVRLGDIAQFEARLAENEAIIAARRLAQAQADFREAVQSLNTAIGMPVSATTEVQTVLPIESEELSTPRRPEIVAAVEARKAAQSRLAAAKRSRLPTVRLFGGYESEENTDRIASVGLSLPLPLYQRNQAEIADTTSDVALQELEVARTRRLVEQELASASFKLQSARELYLRIQNETQLPSMTPAFEEAFREGRIGLNELIVAQRQLFELQRTIVEARLDYQLAWEAYQAALGRYIDDQE